MTTFLSLGLNISPDTVKNCMNLLLKNNYLTKRGGKRTNHYCVTKENKKFWVTDFKNHVLELEKLKEPTKLQFLPIDKREDGE